MAKWLDIYADSKGNDKFFCWDLARKLQSVTSDEYWEQWNAAKQGNCPFKNTCERFKKTKQKYGFQNKLF